MTITINQISSGMALRIGGDLFFVAEYHHVKPGKGSAFVRVKLRNLNTDNLNERTFKTADKLDDVVLDENELEFLYQSGEFFHFMDHTTYEEVVILEAKLGDASKYLLENIVVTGLIFEKKVVKIILPNFITAEIVETEPGIKGDSSRAGNKPAKIETGTTVQIPLFVNMGDWIKMDTRTGQYVERVQK